MTIEQLFTDKSIKSKGKVSMIGDWLTQQELPLEELIVFAEKQKPTDRATCIEAIEYATKKRPDLADEVLLDFVTKRLLEDEPRVKWESAKVIGNICRLFPEKLNETIPNLLMNSGNKGTVVRWATAYALAEILKLKSGDYQGLLKKVEALCEKEIDNGVKKKYLDAIKKVKK